MGKSTLIDMNYLLKSQVQIPSHWRVRVFDIQILEGHNSIRAKDYGGSTWKFKSLRGILNQ
jgi:hypothetical protein